MQITVNRLQCHHMQTLDTENVSVALKTRNVEYFVSLKFARPPIQGTGPVQVLLGPLLRTTFWSSPAIFESANEDFYDKLQSIMNGERPLRGCIFIKSFLTANM